ncbi:hypothetical protein [Elongatibacter sediminis]|uniref:Sel1 repeat family protein n=1 Tax=Elongatibacter sediminis TaxID=3119006 RepID=A0AAW9RB69_9GAMM
MSLTRNKGMAQTAKIKSVAGIVAAVLVVGLMAAWLMSREESSGVDGFGQVSGVDESSSPDDLAAEPDAAVPLEADELRSTILAREAGDSRAGQTMRRAAPVEVTIPRDVVMADYKRDLWTDIQASPPDLEALDDVLIDAEMAYRLYMYYGNCSVLPRTDTQADRRLQQIEDRVERARGRFLERLEGRADQILDDYELCSLIPPDEDARLEAVAWLSEAVRLGHEVAEVQFYEKAMGFILRSDRNTNTPPLALLQPGVVMEFKDTARFAFARAMERGHPEAFLAMSRAVLEGLIYPRDPVLAYAYAVKAEMEAATNRTIASNASYWREAAGQFLDQDQIAEARQLALEMHSTLDD